MTRKRSLPCLVQADLVPIGTVVSHIMSRDEMIDGDVLYRDVLDRDVVVYADRDQETSIDDDMSICI